MEVSPHLRTGTIGLTVQSCEDGKHKFPHQALGVTKSRPLLLLPFDSQTHVFYPLDDYRKSSQRSVEIKQGRKGKYTCINEQVTALGNFESIPIATFGETVEYTSEFPPEGLGS